MVNKATGLSKGYGFVSYAYKQDAQAAIENMDGFRVSYVLSCNYEFVTVTIHTVLYSWERSA
jgi:RNA recognition motif-containing protein